MILRLNRTYCQDYVTLRPICSTSRLSNVCGIGWRQLPGWENGGEKTMNKSVNEQLDGEDELHFFPLEGLLPNGQALSVNTNCLILSLVSTHTVKDNPMLLQPLLTETDARLLLLLLALPYYCPQKVLRPGL